MQFYTLSSPNYIIMVSSASLSLFLSSCFPLLSLLATNCRSDAGLMGNEVRPRAAQSSWAKKYVVVEIPPYCGQRGGEQDGDAEWSKKRDEEDRSRVKLYKKGKVRSRD